MNDVLFGDCLQLMKDIPDQSINLIKADLPFGTTRCSWDTPIDLPKLWAQYKRIIKPNGAILLNAQAPFDKVLGCSNLPWLRYEWIWEKGNATGHLNAKKMPLKAHENILVFYNKIPTYHPQKTTGHVRKVATAAHKRNSKESDIYNKGQKLITYDSTERYPRSVLRFPSDKQKNNLHATQKPVALEEYFILTYTNPGDVVLDNCCGSGTTGEACINTGRNYILMDIDPKAIDTTNERLAKLYNKAY